ncbi:hypothetical protein FACS1894153_0960 [Bacteroidia bacterium]|nr:hypothetical protein FACS1894153_0960 [Bacteroidia bacterium]
MQKLIIILIPVILLLACEPKSDKGQKVARVYDKYLYESDLLNLVPPGTLPEDSIEVVMTYIHNWLQQNLLIEKARKNNFDKNEVHQKLIEDYKNSLMVFDYQNALIEKLLDTFVSQQAIEDYYEENKNQFLLKNNIVKACFVKIKNVNKKKATDIANYVFADYMTDEDIVKLSKLCGDYADVQYLDINKWIVFEELLKEIPIDVVNPQEFLRNNRKFEVPDLNNVYYVHLYDYKLAENISPISFQEDAIKNIIINNRKVKLIEKIYNDMMVEGQQHNNYEIY